MIGLFIVAITAVKDPMRPPSETIAQPRLRMFDYQCRKRAVDELLKTTVVACSLRRGSPEKGRHDDRRSHEDSGDVPRAYGRSAPAVSCHPFRVALVDRVRSSRYRFSGASRSHEFLTRPDIPTKQMRVRLHICDLTPSGTARAQPKGERITRRTDDRAGAR